jgi:hypothetical protein
MKLNESMGVVESLRFNMSNHSKLYCGETVRGRKEEMQNFEQVKRFKIPLYHLISKLTLTSYENEM